MGEEQIKELKRELGGIYDRLTSIETKLAERCDARGEDLKELLRRVRAVENRQYMIFGGLTLLSAVSGYLVKGMGM